MKPFAMHTHTSTYALFVFIYFFSSLFVRIFGSNTLNKNQFAPAFNANGIYCWVKRSADVVVVVLLSLPLNKYCRLSPVLHIIVIHDI